MWEIFWRVSYMWEYLQGNLRLTTNTGELEYVTWDVMRIFFLHWTYSKERQSFVIPFIAIIRNWLYLL